MSRQGRCCGLEDIHESEKNWMSQLLRYFLTRKLILWRNDPVACFPRPQTMSECKTMGSIRKRNLV